MEAIPNRPRSSSFLRVSSLAALSFLLLSACGRPAVTSAPALTDEQLANAEYNAPTPAQGSIRLRDGVYREATGEGSASEVTITLLPELSAFGDLDRDGVADAAAVLAGSGGGTGTFISLAALRNVEGLPQHIATAYLGDRVRVTSLTIDSGELLVTLVSHAPTDPLCCPTLETTRRFRLRQGSLEERKGEGQATSDGAGKEARDLS
jgi:hypothetical protein